MGFGEIDPAVMRAAKAKKVADRKAKVAAFVASSSKNRDLLHGLHLNHAALYVDALEGRLTLKNSVKAKCLECSTWQQDEVTNCTVKACPLWHIRPFQKKA